MHFELLIEDQSGKKMLDILVPKIIGAMHTYKVHGYKGLGRIPKNLKSTTDPNKRILLDRLPKVLNGYGNSSGIDAVIVVCDLDDRCLKSFRQELLDVLNACNSKPNCCFCIAVEEGEAWLLGDIPAIQKAYPKAKAAVLKGYANDSICGTWELLAEAVSKGGKQALSENGYQAVGAEKAAWAEKISPHMVVDQNNSPSFNYFCKQIHECLRRN